jgi:hypothetical protein
MQIAFAPMKPKEPLNKWTNMQIAFAPMKPKEPMIERNDEHANRICPYETKRANGH